MSWMNNELLRLSESVVLIIRSRLVCGSFSLVLMGGKYRKQNVLLYMYFRGNKTIRCLVLRTTFTFVCNTKAKKCEGKSFSTPVVKGISA